MDGIGRSVGIALVGVLGWTPLAQASRSVAPEPVSSWVIEKAEYEGKVSDPVVHFEARYTIRVFREGWVEIPLAIQGATVTEVRIERKAAEAYVLPRGASYALAATRKGFYQVRVSGSALLVQESSLEGIHLGIPQASFSTLQLIVPRKEVELGPEERLYVDAEADARQGGVKLTARMGSANRIDLRWRTKPAAPTQVEPVLYGEVQTLVTIEEELAHVTAMVTYQVTQGQAKELRLQIPAGVHLLNVRGGGIEDWRLSEAPGPKTLIVTLGSPLKEAAYQLVLEGEESIGAEAEDYALAEIQLIGVKQERGYVAVAREGSIEISPAEMEGISRVDVRELPDGLRASSGPSVLLAFKYHQHPYRAALSLTRHEDHPVLLAIAEQGELVSVLSRQGELLTRATYLMKANKKQFLEVRLPEGASLWSCLVSGKSVKPVDGGERRLLVPLEAHRPGVETVPVELVYFERRGELSRIGHLELEGPLLDVPTTVANWLVYVPRTVKLLRVGGNLERGAASFEFLDEPFEPIGTASASASLSNQTLPGGRSGGRAVDALADSDDLKEKSRERRMDFLGALNAVAERPSDRAKYPESRKPVAKAPLERSGLARASSLGRSEEENLEQGWRELNIRLQESGILPLKIRLPKSGNAYRFNRLMSGQEALHLEATFVHLQMPWLPFAAVGLVLLPVGGMVLYRFRR